MSATLLTKAMARELVLELTGLQDSADDPDQYIEKIAALNSIAWGLCRVTRVKQPVPLTADQHSNRIESTP